VPSLSIDSGIDRDVEESRYLYMDPKQVLL
jgi:hypothetical protein